MKKRGPLTRKTAQTPRIREASIQDTCAQWLELDGWLRRIKTDLRHLRGMGVQEKGIADDCFIRYQGMTRTPAELKRMLELGMLRPCDLEPRRVAKRQASADVLWVEWKARDGVIGQKQADWHRLERARGALVWVARQDFEPTIEGFQEHYRKSGLLERSGL